MGDSFGAFSQSAVRSVLAALLVLRIKNEYLEAAIKVFESVS